ncbi:MAG: cation diffusion facilitator family transporter, partial [Chloroflexota bacterium]
MLIVLGISSTILVTETIVGLAANSLALLADAGHVFADVVSTSLALIAIWLAARPATRERSFGFYRFEILVAVLNALLLFAIAGYVLFEAARRIVETCSNRLMRLRSAWTSRPNGATASANAGLPHECPEVESALIAVRRRREDVRHLRPTIGRIRCEHEHDHASPRPGPLGSTSGTPRRVSWRMWSTSARIASWRESLESGVAQATTDGRTTSDIEWARRRHLQGGAWPADGERIFGRALERLARAVTPSTRREIGCTLAASARCVLRRCASSLEKSEPTKGLEPLTCGLR